VPSRILRDSNDYPSAQSTKEARFHEEALICLPRPARDVISGRLLPCQHDRPLPEILAVEDSDAVGP
jgi:hypothetical protein